MSEETKSGEGQDTQDERQTVDVNEVLKRIEQLESTNKRLLDESKSLKSQASEYKSKLDETEKMKVEASGDLEAKLKYERDQKEKLAKEAKSLKNKTLDQNIRITVGKYAKDVHSIDDLLNQPQFKKIIQDGIDPENLTLDEDAAKDFVNKVLEAKPWMKKNVHQPGVDKTKPNASSLDSSFDVNNVKKGEHKDLLKQALNKW